MQWLYCMLFIMVLGRIFIVSLPPENRDFDRFKDTIVKMIVSK